MRIALLVLIIPPALVGIAGGAPDGLAVLTGGDLDLVGAGLLLAIAAAGGFVFRLVRISSPFFLGALGFSAAAAALSLPVSMPPFVVLASGQVLLGVWLGCMFDRDMLVRSRSFIPAALFSTLLLLALCVAMAFAISGLTGIDWQVMVLATAPGSVTEMALTAKSPAPGRRHGDGLSRGPYLHHPPGRAAHLRPHRAAGRAGVILRSRPAPGPDPRSGPRPLPARSTGE
jgi:uncharacterized protein